LRRSAIALLLLPLPVLSQQIPRTEFTTLTGTKGAVPREGGAKPLVILISFSHKGADDLTAWNKLFKSRYEGDPRVDYFELADFEGVPSLVMKMILHGMKRSVPEVERPHFAPFYTHDGEWKKLVSFENPQVTYVIVADSAGRVLWQTHGPASEAGVSDLENAIMKLTSK